MYIYRELNTKNIEIFRLSNSMYEDTKAYCAIIDFRRPSTLKDYPYLIGIEDENEFGSENFIKAIVISNEKLESSSEEEIVNIIEGMIGSKDDCDWNSDFRLTNLDLNEVYIEEVFEEIKTVLLNEFNYKLNIENIEKLNFNHLLQE